MPGVVPHSSLDASATTQFGGVPGDSLDSCFIGEIR
jgi:hypothetical protein